MKRLVSISALALTVACSQKTEPVESDLLYADIPPQKEHVDSLILGQPIPLTVADTISFPELTTKPVSPEITPLKTANVYPLGDTSVTTIPERIQKPIVPDTLETQPFIAYVSHPKPLKAGEMRSTGAAREHIQYLSVEQGLTSPNVNCIAEDQFGFLWFALNNGLTRYDGTYLYNYTVESGLPSNTVHEVFVDSKNNLWISTSRGMVHYDGIRFEIYDRQNGLPDPAVACFSEDSEGNIWFISEGVIKFDGKRFYHYSKENGLRSNQLTTIGFNNSGELFLGYFATTAEHLKNDTLYEYADGTNLANVLGSNIYQKTMVDRSGEFWLCNYNASVVHIRDNQVSVKYNLSRVGLPRYSIDDLLEDNRGNIWMSSIESGILKLEPDHRLKAYTTVQGLNTNFITDLFEDRKGNIWVGTLGGGVNKIVPGSFRFYDQTDGFSPKTSYRFHLDQHKNLMMGTWADGIFSFDGTNIYKHRKDIGEIIAFSFIQDSFGHLLVGGHQFGVYDFTPSLNDTVLYDSLRNWREIQDFQFWGIRSMELDENGNVWLFDDSRGAFRAVLNEDRSDYAYIEHYTAESGLTSDSWLYSEKRGNEIWATGGKLGLSKIEDQTITNFTMANGLLSNSVISLFTDSEQNLWIGTAEGVNIYDGQNFSTITVKDGLSDNSIRSIVQDNKGRIWLGTAQGLNLLEKDESRACGYAISVYAAQDGLQSTDFISNCVQLDSNHTLWWGTRTGIVSLDLNNFEKKQEIPQVYLTELYLLDQHVDFGAEAAPQKPRSEADTVDTFRDYSLQKTEPFFNVPVELTLPYWVNSITFGFSADVGQSSRQMRYRYRLIGFDDNWSLETPDAFAKFSNLPAGDYTFEVQAGLHNKAWGPIASCSFRITPPFWETWWFRILAVLLMLLIIYLIFKWRNRALIQRQQQLERTVAERTHEIQEQKTLIEEKQIEILDSINYAQRIQRALLATDELLKKNLRDYFIFFQPKDIVSGDFYWATETTDEQFILVTADSTGHGVPGAIMSMLNISSLEKAIESEGLTEPAAILNSTRTKIIDTLSKDGSAEGGKDGMDCSLIKLDFKTLHLTYAAANNGIWIIRRGELLEFAPDKMPVGKHDRDQNPFQQHRVDLEKGDLIFTFTDGLPDQFGGDKGKKFKYKALKALLLKNAEQPLQYQLNDLRETFIRWKGDLEQIDDICIVGIKI